MSTTDETEARNDLIVAKTETALGAIGELHGMSGFAQAAAVEFHALVDGSVTITERGAGGDAIARRATVAEAAAATLFCVHHGLSSAAGHVILLGGKLYVTAEGWEAAAENTGLFDGFGDPEPMTPAECELFAVPKTATARVKIRAYRRGRDRGAVGYGWWDKDKDYEGDKSVPGMTALTRAKRRALRSLFPLSAGTRLPPGERPSHVMAQTAQPDEVGEATAVVERVVTVEAKERRTDRPPSDSGDRGELVEEQPAAPAKEAEDDDAHEGDAPEGRAEDGGTPVEEAEAAGGAAAPEADDASEATPAEGAAAPADTDASGEGDEATDVARPDTEPAAAKPDKAKPVELDRGKIVAGLQAAWSKHPKAFDTAIKANGIKSAKDVPTADTPTLAKVLADIDEAVKA